MFLITLCLACSTSCLISFIRLLYFCLDTFTEDKNIVFKIYTLIEIVFIAAKYLELKPIIVQLLYHISNGLNGAASFIGGVEPGDNDKDFQRLIRLRISLNKTIITRLTNIKLPNINEKLDSQITSGNIIAIPIILLE